MRMLATKLSFQGALRKMSRLWKEQAQGESGLGEVTAEGPEDPRGAGTQQWLWGTVPMYSSSCPYICLTPCLTTAAVIWLPHFLL